MLVSRLFGRREQLVALLVAAAIVFGVGYWYALLQVREPDVPVVLERAEETEKEELTVQVHVHVV